MHGEPAHYADPFGAVAKEKNGEEKFENNDTEPCGFQENGPGIDSKVWHLVLVLEPLDLHLTDHRIGEGPIEPADGEFVKACKEIDEPKMEPNDLEMEAVVGIIGIDWLLFS